MGFKERLPKYDLTGKVAIVTGGSRGIGFDVAGTLAAAGAAVVITGRKQATIEAAAQQLKDEGFDALGLAVDVSSIESVQKMAEDVVAKYGKIDILINNAGVTVDEAPMLDVTEEDWDYVHNTDLKGFYFTTQAVARKMKEVGNGGRIINVTSAAGIMTPKYITVYGSAKVGVTHLTKIFSKELARYGIHVNAVAPGYVNTSMIANMVADEKNANVVLKSIPLRRYAEVEDVSNVILFLVTEAGDYLNGVVIPIDGGMMA